MGGLPVLVRSRSRRELGEQHHKDDPDLPGGGADVPPVPEAGLKGHTPLGVYLGTGGLFSASLFAVSDQVEIAIITGFFTFLTTFATAVIAYLNRRDIRRYGERGDRIERKVSAPRRIGAREGEDGPVVLPPDDEGISE